MDVTLRPPGEGAGTSDGGVPAAFVAPTVLRHNRLFLFSDGIPGGGEAMGKGIERPMITAGCRYSDMIRDTVYMAATNDFDRLRRHMENRQQVEVDRAEASAIRFHRQRGLANYWSDLEDTFAEARGRRPATSSADAAAVAAAAPARAPEPVATPPAQVVRTPTSPPAAPGISRSASTPSQPSSPSTGPRSAAFTPKRSPSTPGAGLSSTAYLRASKLVLRGGRGTGRTGVGNADPGEYVPFPQVRGSRGLPPDMIPAQSSHMGLLVWQHNRSHTIASMRARGLA